VRRLSLLVAGAALASCNSAPASYPDQCGERLKGWLGPENGIGELAIWDVVRLDKTGSLNWNRRQITAATLAKYLREVSDDEQRPQIILTIEPGADCSVVDKVRALMNSAPICSQDGVCGEGTGWKDPATGRVIS
jgi:hypothetical protein